MRAKHLAEVFAKSNWPDSPLPLKIVYIPGGHDDAYYRDTRPMTESGWYHFVIVGTYIGVGGAPLLIVNPVSGEVFTGGFVGE